MQQISIRPFVKPVSMVPVSITVTHPLLINVADPGRIRIQSAPWIRIRNPGARKVERMQNFETYTELVQM